ncbi:MAG TPA: hypothetical protein VLL07_06575 [Pontiella sp.]|nr:hypothetical protein [Pontiella sp.]
MMKRTIAAWIAAIAVSVCGETFETDDEVSITLPDGWVQIPGNVLQEFSETMDVLSPDTPRQVYDYGYQKDGDGNWLSYPYILVQFRPTGRIPSGELARYQQMSTQMLGDIGLSEVRLGTSSYDREHQILWSMLSTHARNGETVKALVAVKLTEVGYIRLTGCATAESFDEYETVFRDTFSSLGIAESIAYKPQFADTMPVIGGIMTGKVVVWFVQAVMIGGVLWLAYIALKRLARKPGT